MSELRFTVRPAGEQWLVIDTERPAAAPFSSYDAPDPAEAEVRILNRIARALAAHTEGEANHA